MASVQFAGTTIWNDATTGVGPVGVQEIGAVARRLRWPVLGGNGFGTTELGTDGGGVRLFLQYRLTEAEYGSLRSSIATIRDKRGSISWPPSDFLSDCEIEGSPAIIRGPVVRYGDGTVKYQVQVVIGFVQQKA